MSSLANPTGRKRYYLAARKDRSAEANALAEALNAQGWTRTYEWTPADGEGTEGHAHVARAELEGVRQADVLVAMLPGGFGTHVEIGAALALGKPVILHSPDQKTLDTPYPCVFHYHSGVTILISEVLEVDSVIARMTQSK